MKLIKDKKGNRCYSISYNLPIRYDNGCSESKNLSLKYPHLKLLIQTSQFYMRSWQKLLKSKHCYSFNINLPWMKFWRWRYLRNHGFLLCEKCQCLKSKYTEVIHKKYLLSFLKTRNCVWHLWTCPIRMSFVIPNF